MMQNPRPDEPPAPERSDFFEPLRAATGSVVSLASGVGKRVLAHGAGLALAGCSLFVSGGGYTAAAFAGIYVGLICLFPRNDGGTARWAFPTATGLAQTALLLLLGLPWEAAPAWGGAQTWCQRFLQKKGRMGWEFSVLPALCAALGLALVSLKGGMASLWPLASFLPILPLGYALDQAYAAKSRRAAPSGGTSPASAALEAHRGSVSLLRSKKSGLATEMQPVLHSLCDTADSILGCMSRDAENFAPGDAFLSRYLPAAHQMADEYARLGREGRGVRPVDDALARCSDLLLRLEKAFAAEHAQLLRNDAVNFTADLNLLDKLLKIKGQ